jgi:hypothetical protein
VAKKHITDFTLEDAKLMRSRALEQAKGLEIDKMIRYLLKNARNVSKIYAKDTAPGDPNINYFRMPIPGSGVVITMSPGKSAVGAHNAENGTTYFQAYNDGKDIRIFRNGAWVQTLQITYLEVRWHVENPETADLVKRFSNV